MSARQGRTPLIPQSPRHFYGRMAKAWRPPASHAVAIAKLSRIVELHHRDLVSLAGIPVVMRQQLQVMVHGGAVS